MKLNPSLLGGLAIALTGTALQQPQEIAPCEIKPAIVPRRRKVLTPEQEAIYLAHKVEIDAELERKHQARVQAKQAQAFERLNAAEIKRERKRAKARKDNGYETPPEA